VWVNFLTTLSIVIGQTPSNFSNITSNNNSNNNNNSNVIIVIIQIYFKNQDDLTKLCKYGIDFF
jgi:hypothetical protein